MKKSILTLAMMAAALTLFAGLACAGDKFASKGGWHQRGGMAVELTAEQQSALQKIRAEQRASTNELRQQFTAKKEALATEFKADKPDAKALEKLSRELGEIHGKLLGERVKFREQLVQAGIPLPEWDKFIGHGQGKGGGCCKGGGHGRGMHKGGHEGKGGVSGKGA
jgi:Spy/CpxP family protein refolding chaperone